MICPNCKKENDNGAAFCMHCGSKLSQENNQTNNLSENKNRESSEGGQTSEEPLQTKIIRGLFYISLIVLILAVLGKIMYKESISYAYETETSGGYFEYGNTTPGSGEQIVLVKICPLNIESLGFSSETAHCYSAAEANARLEELHNTAIDNYQSTMNTFVIIMTIITAAIYVLSQYVKKNRSL